MKDRQGRQLSTLKQDWKRTGAPNLLDAVRHLPYIKPVGVACTVPNLVQALQAAILCGGQAVQWYSLLDGVPPGLLPRGWLLVTGH